MNAAPNSARITEPMGTYAGTGVSAPSSTAMMPPTSIPITPPTVVRVAASTRNCHRIARRVAPSALRTPISRVRSVTEIIMIATTPIPPTMRPTMESATITILNIKVLLFTASRYLSWVTTSNVFGWPGRRPRMARRATVTSSIASCSATLSSGATKKSIHPCQ